ncbi:MAG TPA: hypothetical protein VKD91_15885, partial [Pyrinomonadaceae bacterium]|nr:hypothetical protein [Pyrinomonadaceae bacterium]
MHTDESVVGGRRSVSVDWLAGLLLFTAAAAIVVWQNSRLAVLWDLSYILENANRIALGQVPYRDFPFPYAPLTFLIQAALIKLGGRVFWHTVVYCAVLNGLAIVLTWRILVNLLRDMGKQVRWLAILLTLPLIPLGIYSIFPHPFYDPDCTFAILVAIYLWQRAGQSVRSARLWSLFAGAALVVPLFVKQNTGLPFVGSAALALALLIAIELIRRRPVGQYLAMIAGAATAVVVAFSLLSFTAGLRNYWHWTIQFAASRRTPARAEMLEIYSGKTLLLWLGLFLSGAVVLRLSHRGKNHLLRLLSALLLAAPFVWPAIYLWRDNDTSEQAERLVNTWPLLIIVSFIV